MAARIGFALAGAALVSGVAAQGTRTTSAAGGCYDGYAATPLAAKRFQYDELPYKIDTNTNDCRGAQVGYNICNSTTAGQDSMCQTAYINSIDDFCLWGPPGPGELVGNIEGEMVAWCTKEGRGTRLIPEGALQGVQFLKAPAYVQVTGFIDQSKINMDPEDDGGEMDPHGADGKGNPIGGVIFSQQFTDGAVSETQGWRQVVEWHNFMGGNVFCLKACDPDNAQGPQYCQHIFDRIGCQYNAPAAYVNGTFESCESDNQLFPGVYVTNGQTRTYTQPAESLGPITTLPYTAQIPASSQCTTYTSSLIYSQLANVQISGTGVTSSSASSTAAASSTITDSQGRTTVVSATGVRGANNAQTTSASGSGAGFKSASYSGALSAVAGIVAFVCLGAAL